jgi:hypothetical protein
VTEIEPGDAPRPATRRAGDRETEVPVDPGRARRSHRRHRAADPAASAVKVDGQRIPSPSQGRGGRDACPPVDGARAEVVRADAGLTLALHAPSGTYVRRSPTGRATATASSRPSGRSASRTPTPRGWSTSSTLPFLRALSRRRGGEGSQRLTVPRDGGARPPHRGGRLLAVARLGGGRQAQTVMAR